MPWTPEDFTHHLPSPTWQVRPQVERVVQDAGPNAVGLDLGAGGRRLAPNVLCVDFIPFDGTDLVGDVERLPFTDNSVDLIVATGLLEHVADDRALLNETCRVLKPGGVAHFELPFLQHYHDDPIDNRRLTVPGLAREMERAGMETERSGFHIGPTVALLHFFIYYMATVFEGKNVVSKVISNVVFAVLSVCLFWLRYLDFFLKNKRSAHRLAYGVYCTSRKPLSTSS
jgi:SAM-dependent methyltransferase